MRQFSRPRTAWGILPAPRRGTIPRGVPALPQPATARVPVEEEVGWQGKKRGEARRQPAMERRVRQDRRSRFLPLWGLASLLVMGGACRSDSRSGETLPSAGRGESPIRHSEFECTDTDGHEFRFTVRFSEGRALLLLPDRFGPREAVLPQTISASGARYEGGGILFWNKGEEALLEVDGLSFPGCFEVPQAHSVWEEAARRGVTFRAVGQEPGWVLEVWEGERLSFRYDYGQQELEAPRPRRVADPDGNAIRYQAAVGKSRLEASLTGGPCTDSMSGSVYEKNVLVELDGRRFQGCGSWVGGARLGMGPL